jgi:acyl-CoA reductase-like NAD-dependent aldehyde dehydrogenase
MIFRERAMSLAKIVALETGKSVKDALGEVGAAVEMGFFVAGKGRRFYGKTTTSAVPNKAALVVRQPLGVAGLIIAANTPIANVAWKVFPALLCGNAAVLKSSEDTPLTAWMCARIFSEAGVPPGRVQCGPWVWRGGRRALGGSPGCRRGELHRIHRGRAAHSKKCRGSFGQGLP